MNIYGTEIDTEKYPYVAIAEKRHDDGSIDGKVLGWAPNHGMCLRIAQEKASLPENRPYGVSVVPAASIRAKALDLGGGPDGIL